VQLLAKAHLKVKRQRQDFHHKAALRLVQENDTIYHEDLQTANMVKNHSLAKSISDAGWSAFLSILSAKAAWAGRRVVAVPPAYTSQTCSGCGVLVHKGLSVRWHSCPDCGTSLHRDHNAARNIESLGQRLRGGVALAAAENRESPGFSRGECQLRWSRPSIAAHQEPDQCDAVKRAVLGTRRPAMAVVTGSVRLQDAVERGARKHDGNEEAPAVRSNEARVQAGPVGEQCAQAGDLGG